MFLKSLKRKVRQYPGFYFPLKQAYRAVTARHTPEHIRARVHDRLANLNFHATPKKTVPKGALIEITNACNLNCKMCNTKMSTREPRLMSPEVFERIIKETKAAGVTSVSLHTVGETFVYKDLSGLLSILDKHDMDLWMSTNAMFPDKIRALHREFPHLARIFRFSVDGASKETFEDIRVGGNFEKLIESFEVVHEINEEKPNSKIYLSVDATISVTNFHEIPDFFRMFGKYVWPEDIRFHLINGLSPSDTYFRATFPWENLIRWNPTCRQPFSSMHFTYDGQATLCCRDYNAEITVGDITKESYMDIWNGAAAEEVRRQHLNPNELTIEACKACYSPHSIVSDVASDFAYFLYMTEPGLTNEAFGARFRELMDAMNDTFDISDPSSFKNTVSGFFAFPA